MILTSLPTMIGNSDTRFYMINPVAQNSQLLPENMVVAKFGGTSVADFDAMNRSADIVLSNNNVRLVVLSASAGVTNLLVELAEGKDANRRLFLLDEIRRIQDAIITRLENPLVIRQEIDRMLENIAMLSEAASLATSTALTDELVSHGELMSTLLFVEILRQRQVTAEWFDVRKVMRTNDRFGRATPDTDVLAQLAGEQLRPRLQQALIITQGFIGSEAKGRTTTLGRGGSDYTAALLGEALHLSRVDIWTDVPGIYTTDPRLVPAAKRIDRIAFEEAAEMATFGAKVLHPATLLPAVRQGIPVFVGSSKDPSAGGTLVCSNTENPPLFRALALRRKQTLLTLHSLSMLHSQGFLAEVFGILVRHNISVDLITTSEVSVALTLDTTGSTSAGDSLLTTALLTELSSLCRVEVEENLALIALIGNQLSHSCGVGKEVFGVLDPFNIRMICYGASSHNLCFLVPGDDANQVIQTLHHNIFE
jgi:aspartate kinase